MSPETQQKVLDRWARDPGNASAENVLRLNILAGKIAAAGTANNDDPLLALINRRERMIKRLLESQSHTHAEMKRLEEKLRVKKARMVFRNDPRKIIFEYSVWESFAHRTCDHADDGQRIGWTHREQAIEWFRINLYRLKEVGGGTLREITLAGHAAGRFVGTMPEIDPSVTRAGPPTQDWKKVRDRVQKAA